jgi:hypothetical protein
MDKDAKVARAYGVRGIPQTVIIGKDGKVASVHVGFRPDLHDLLKRELDALLAKDAPKKTAEE